VELGAHLMPKLQTLDEGIIQIDTEMVGLDQTVAAFFVPGERPAVVETGPATVTATLTAGLDAIGIPRSDVAYFVMSHIHLDHAGAAGDLMELFPNATVVVHTEGARHMIDPTKLMASAYRVFGDALDRTFGPLRAVPESRLMAVDPGAVLDLGGRSLEIIEATGHARHHMGIQDSASGVIFVGDSMGVYLPEAGVLRPATPPPDFDLEVAIATLRRFRERDPRGLYLTHFGPAPADRDMLAEAEERLVRYGAIVREAMTESTDVAFLAERLRERTWDDYAAIHDRPDLLQKFEALNAFGSSAAGYLRYFQTSGR
jgi:glyoxylase-like metal-dependent hydrolase (beta-lactamase superfamily II)